MKNILITLLLIINIHCYGQNKTMIINQRVGGLYTSYRGPTTKIDSFSELPSFIQVNINGYLKRILGSMSDSIQFAYGQEINLQAIFKKYPITFYGDAIKPKYELNFILSDSSIGIISYHLQLRLDEYGQLLKINWPRKRWNDKSKFLLTEKIKQFVLEQAKLRKYDTTSYKIYFRYNEAFDKLCWAFMFPELSHLRKYGKNKKISKRYNVLEIDWKDLRIVARYQHEEI